MNKKILPAVGIVLVSVVLMAINEFTDLTFIEDYAFILIIVGMLLGVGLTKIADI